MAKQVAEADPQLFDQLRAGTIDVRMAAKTVAHYKEMRQMEAAAGELFPLSRRPTQWVALARVR